MDFETQLIRQVKERPCLYNQKTRTNTKSVDRLLEWEGVSAALRIPMEDCRKRWRSLRDRFVKEKKKLDQQGDQLRGKELQWEYYSELTFLNDSLQTSKNKRMALDMKTEESQNFIEMNNSCDVGSPIIYESFDEMYDEGETTQFPTQDEKQEIPTTSVIIENCPSPEQEQFDCIKKSLASLKRKASVTFLKTSPPESFKNNLSKSKYAKIPRHVTPKSNKSQRFSESFQNTQHQQPVLIQPQSTLEMPDGFLSLMNDLKSELNKVISVEKDENDMFMECMALKMKNLSQRAKLRIQQKLLASITEELLEES